MTARGIPHLEEDDRLLPLLTNLSKQYLGEDYAQKTTATGNIRLEDMDTVSFLAHALCTFSQSNFIANGWQEQATDDLVLPYIQKC